MDATLSNALAYLGTGQSLFEKQIRMFVEILLWLPYGVNVEPLENFYPWVNPLG